MSFPFGRDVSSLKQRLLLAIGGGGVIGIALAGCSNSAGNDMPGGQEAGSGGSAGSHAGTGGVSAGTGGLSAGAGGMSGGGGMMNPPTQCTNGAPQKMCLSRSEMESKAKFGCGQIATSPEPTPAQVMAAFLPSGCLPKNMACDGCCNPSETDGVPMGDGSCCYSYCVGSCCGRPFDVGGELRMAGVAAREDWGPFLPVAAAPSAEPPSWLARRIAREWLEDARMEHASIASFARFTLDLLAAGAPADLLALAQQAALDEVAHAQLCFALGTRYSGTAHGPSALRTDDCRPAASMHDAVLGAFREGCVGETLAAAQAARGLEHARDPQARAALERIAADEARHAELAWRFVAWGLPRCAGDTRTAIAAELAAALAAQPAPASEHELDVVRDALHAAGRLTASERDMQARHTLREVVVPCAEALLALSCDLGVSVSQSASATSVQLT